MQTYKYNQYINLYNSVKTSIPSTVIKMNQQIEMISLRVIFSALRINNNCLIVKVKLKE